MVLLEDRTDLCLLLPSRPQTRDDASHLASYYRRVPSLQSLEFPGGLIIG